MRVEFVGQDSTARIATRLVELCERHGDPTDGAIEIRLPITQADLGSWTATSRAGVTSALRTMRELGWIKTERRRLIVLDLESLQRRAG
jgi:CRP-like cAMP-binding protein